MRRHETLVSLAKALGVSPKTLGRWRNLWSGFPEKRDGGWDLAEVKKWRRGQTEERRRKKRISHKRAALTDPDPEEDPSAEPTEREQASLKFADEKLKYEAIYRKAKAERAILDLDIAKGGMIPIEEVEKMFADRVHELRGRMDPMGRTLAPQIVGKIDTMDVQSRIDAETHAICEHFSRALPIKRFGKDPEG